MGSQHSSNWLGTFKAVILEGYIKILFYSTLNECIKRELDYDKIKKKFYGKK